jgi:hypothetical protein
MANGGRASKGFSMGNPHVTMLPEPDRKRQNEDYGKPNQTRRRRIQRGGLVVSESDSGLFSC